MAETLTANFSWTKPDPGASANTWGATLNADLDKIDAQVFANQTAINAGQVPIGSISMFGGATPPTGWLLCNGASLATAGTYAALFAIIGYTYGGGGANFNLPNLIGRFPIGANGAVGLAGTGGEASHILTAAEMPVHAHPITDITHTHGLNQSPHNHGDPGHTHGVSDPTHFHTGLFRQTGSPTAGATGSSLGAGSQTDAAATGISIQAGAANIQANNAIISLSPSGTGLSATQNAGSGGAHNNLPPYLQLNFIVRFQ